MTALLRDRRDPVPRGTAGTLRHPGLHRRATGAFCCVATLLLAGCRDQPTAAAGPEPSTPSAVEASTSASADELVGYELTIANLKGLNQAQQSLYRLAQRDPAPVERLEEEIEEIPVEDVSAIVAAIDAEPLVRNAIEKSSFTARDYHCTQINLVRAVFVLDARAAGRTTELPEVSNANLAFVRDNRTLVDYVMTHRRPGKS